MEENKTTQEAVKTAEKKFTYEQLEAIANQLSEQNQQLFAKLKEASMANLFKRLDYLFKVLEFKENFAQEFVETCAKEINSLIEIPEEVTE